MAIGATENSLHSQALNCTLLISSPEGLAPYRMSNLLWVLVSSPYIAYVEKAGCGLVGDEAIWVNHRQRKPMNFGKGEGRLHPQKPYGSTPPMSMHASRPSTPCSSIPRWQPVCWLLQTQLVNWILIILIIFESCLSASYILASCMLNNSWFPLWNIEKLEINMKQDYFCSWGVFTTIIIMIYSWYWL